MNKSRREEIQAEITLLEGQISRIEELESEERECFDNMPESFQSGEKGEAAEAAADALSMAKDSLQEAIEYLTEAAQ